MECDWLFCCDGDDVTGLGHVGRCLGYAEMLADKGASCVFRGSFNQLALCMIEGSGFVAIPAQRLGLQRIPMELPVTPTRGVLLDSYQVDAQEIEVIQNQLLPLRLLLLDDFAKHAVYHCAAVINFTIGAASLDYPKTMARLYLGLDFFPARRWLRRLRAKRYTRSSQEVCRLLVVAGGRDICGLNTTILTLLDARWRSCEVALVLGDDDETRGALAPLSGRFPNLQVLPSQPNLEHWLDWADVCLCGGGLVKYECLFAGVPVASLAQNAGQLQDSAHLAEHGLIANLGSGQQPQWEQAKNTLSRFMDEADWREAMRVKGIASVGGSLGDGGVIPFALR
jgi:spore coat polysaccharide biosynthesis predicted glycosyltransferase SpsG